ncbi:hypothetical protein [Methylobacterium oryzisoli]|uniref:hypothetical protein n=1 Tax=Methylobacterium oryzisoli TaxID=3385502 RepID=UPI003891EB71
MSASTSRGHLQRLLDENEATIAGDRLLFVRWPERCHRVRLASVAEVRTLELLGERHVRVGYRWHTTVRRLGPDFRVRVFLVGREDIDTDLIEEATHLFAPTASVRQRSAT